MDLFTSSRACTLSCTLPSDVQTRDAWDLQGPLSCRCASCRHVSIHDCSVLREPASHEATVLLDSNMTSVLRDDNTPVDAVVSAVAAAHLSAGPVTILNWSFPRKDVARSVQAFQLALALRDEVADLEAAGCKIIQVLEPNSPYA